MVEPDKVREETLGARLLDARAVKWSIRCGKRVSELLPRAGQSISFVSRHYLLGNVVRERSQLLFIWME